MTSAHVHHMKCFESSNIKLTLGVFNMNDELRADDDFDDDDDDGLEYIMRYAQLWLNYRTEPKFLCVFVEFVIQ